MNNWDLIFFSLWNHLKRKSAFDLSLASEVVEQLPNQLVSKTLPIWKEDYPQVLERWRQSQTWDWVT
jgi:hypothetical protein